MNSIIKRTLSSAFAIGLLASVTSCTQSQNYSANKASGTYLTVPDGWNKITSAQLRVAEKKSTAQGAAARLAGVVWQEAYSTTKITKPESVFSLDATDGAVAYVRVRNLNFDELNSVSYNALRNVIVPLTTWLATPKEANSGFLLIDEYERVEKVARGVRSIYTFADPNGVLQTVDQTALVSDDRTRIYLLIIRAPNKYFTKNLKVLQKIGDSFTVRGDK